MTGHTHEDVDQLFSCFSRLLQIKAAHSLPELFEVFEKCYTTNSTTPNPRAKHVGKLPMYDIKTWLDPVRETMRYHTGPHCFRITRENGKAVLHTKKWSTDKRWVPVRAEEGSEPHLLTGLPTGEANLLEPHYDTSEVHNEQGSTD